MIQISKALIVIILSIPITSAHSKSTVAPTISDFQTCISELYKSLWVYRSSDNTDAFIPIALRADGHVSNRFFTKTEEAFLYFDGSNVRLYKSNTPTDVGSERQYRFVIRPDMLPPQTTEIRISNKNNTPTVQGGGGTDLAAIKKTQTVISLNQEDLVELFNTPFTETELKRIEAHLIRNQTDVLAKTVHQFEAIKNEEGQVVGGNSRKVVLTETQRNQSIAAYKKSLEKDIADLKASCGGLGHPTIMARTQALITKLNATVDALQNANGEDKNTDKVQ